MGSIPTRPTTDESGTFVDFALWLKRTNRNCEDTIAIKVRRIKYLSNCANLWDAKAVSDFVQDGEWSEGYKESLEQTYLDWSKFQGFDFKPHAYRRNSKIPYIPTESELDAMISNAKREYACYLQFLKESGWRPSEPLTLTPMDVDLERGLATLNMPKKHSNPRQVKLSARLVAMLYPLVRDCKPSERIWDVSQHTVAKNVNRLKKRLAIKLADINLTKITLYTFRHWKATMEYHRTKDILHVMQLLGHKNIKNTLIYTHLVNFESDEFVCKVATSLEECTELLESGFDYVTDFEGKKLFRKRK